KAPALARVGCAWPAGLAPPLRPGPATPTSNPELQAELTQQLGQAAALCGDGGLTLRQKILAAAHALREGRPVEAGRLQLEARDFCLDAGLFRETTLLEMILASYLLAANQRSRALAA